MAVFLNYTQEELDRQYEHRHFVSDVPYWRKIAKAENERVRAAAKGLFNLSYGKHLDELLDVYKTKAQPSVPTVIFFHGGRWRKGSKASACHSAEAFTEAGAHFVSVNYSLLPDVTMDTLIDQCRKAVAWIYDNAASFGADPDKLFIMGKSAGAHIGGMMVTTDWAAYGLPKDVLKGALLISGMYDLEPVRLTFRNEWLKLDRDAAVRNSPIRHVANGICPIVIGCGTQETDEFRRQTKEFAQAWQRSGRLTHYLEVPNQHHYSINLFLQNNPLFAKMQDMMQI